MQIPSAYLEGYEKKARPHEQVLADLYIKHTTIGDPLMDPIMEEISSLPAYELHAFVEAGIEGHDGVLRDTPQPLRFLNTKQIVKSQNFSQLLQISVYDEGGISYRMPDSVKASESSKW